MATRQKYGGRQKGGVNKTTAEIRLHYQTLITDNLEKLKNDLEALEPLQRLKMIIELSKFVIPQLKATDLLIETEPATNIINLGIGAMPIPDIGNRGISPERQEEILRQEIRRIDAELETKY